ncbi:MAG: cell division protein ZapA [Pseudomonadota bacterium]
MPDVEVSILGRTYKLACQEGQEARLREVAAMLDGYARSFGTGAQDVPENRLMLMIALMCGDELADAKAKLRSLDAALKADNPAAAQAIEAAEAKKGAEEEAADLLNLAAERMERMAERLRDEKA